MIKDNEVNIKIVGRNLNYYRSLNYKCKAGDNILVKVNDVQKNSHIKITAICDRCGKESYISIQKYNKNYNNYNFYTCKQCSNVKVQMTNIDKYGCKAPLQNKLVYNKLKKTNLDKYGVENVFESMVIKQKIISTNNEKYGVDYPQQNKEILQKSNETNLERYGVKRPSENIDIQEKCKNTKKYKYGDSFFNNSEKAKNTILYKYNIDNVSKLSKHKENIQKYYTSKLLLKYDFIYNVDYPKNIYYCKCEKSHDYQISIKLFHNRLSHSINTCTICYPENTLSSIKELELLKFIKENYKGVIIENDRKVLSGKEIDVLLPELKLAFEYNGLYWHSNIYKNNDYHKNKMLECNKNNIQLIHIWEDDWIYNNTFIKNIILKYINKQVTYNDDIIELESFYVNDELLNKYNIIEKTNIKKWSVYKNKRIEYDKYKNMPYIYDCGTIKLIKKNV